MSIASLEEKLNYSFRNPDLLQQALTHTSLRRVGQSWRHNTFERLEFLGDRVLGLVIAHYLHHTYPNEQEGDLAKRSAYLISREVCAQIANQLDLQRVLKVRSREVFKKSAVLSHAMEALIGAIYLDGGLEVAQHIIECLWATAFQEPLVALKDAKSQLQEWAQKNGEPIPVYELVEQTGPAHAPKFKIYATILGVSAEATGASRRIAEQGVAEKLLILLKKRERKK